MSAGASAFHRGSWRPSSTQRKLSTVARTHRKHLSKGKLSKRGDHGQPKTRSKPALDSFLRTGAGFHGKSRKQERAADRAKFRKGEYDV